jgi:hypothetical protein
MCGENHLITRRLILPISRTPPIDNMANFKESLATLFTDTGGTSLKIRQVHAK